MSIIGSFIENVRKGVFGEPGGFENKPEKKMAVLTEWYYMAYQGLGLPRKEDLTYVREIAKTTACRIVIETILSEVRSTEHVVRPKDQLKYNPKNLDIAKNFFDKPNYNNESIDDITAAFANDLLEVDAGVIVHVFNKQGWIEEIYARDGASFLINTDIYGVIPDAPTPAYFQYSYKYPRAKPLGFTRNEISYAKLHPKSYSPYGWSPVQSIKILLEALNNSFDWNKQFFENHAVPDGLVSVLNTNDKGLDRFKSIWNKELKGQPHKMMFWNQDMKFTPFSPTAREMEFLSSQQWYLRLVATNFGVSANEIALTADVNRATAGSQERINVKRALRPVLEKIESVFTNDVIAHLKGSDGKPITDIEFKYLHVDPMEEEQNRINEERDLRNNVKTINEVRTARGDKPIPGGDDIQRRTSPTLDEISDRLGREKKTDEDAKKKLDAMMQKAPKMVQDSKHYDEVISDIFNEWMQKVMSALNRAKEEWLDAFKKTLPTTEFYAKVENAVKHDFMIGVGTAENEMNLDVGFPQDLAIKADSLTAEQIYGYSLPDGQVWPGIKGFTSEMTASLAKIISSGASSQEPLTVVKQQVIDAFNVSANRATIIARTETNRIINQGRISAWKEAKLHGRMQWHALHDDKTSEICNRLDGQIVSIGADFVDPATGSRFKGPPAHPNCRSTVLLVADE